MASPALRVLFVAIVGCALPSAARGQMPPIAAIDYYGLRSVPADRSRRRSDWPRAIPCPGTPDLP